MRGARDGLPGFGLAEGRVMRRRIFVTTSGRDRHRAICVAGMMFTVSTCERLQSGVEVWGRRRDGRITLAASRPGIGKEGPGGGFAVAGYRRSPETFSNGGGAGERAMQSQDGRE